MRKVDKSIKNYIEKNIFPKYDKYYAHGMIHINAVIENMMMLADYYHLDKNMAYVIASYHDAGLSINRKNHEKESGKLLSNDIRLREWFTPEEMNTMKEAIEDHRGSRKIRPRNFYGECVSDSDRDFDISILARRQINTTLKCYPNIKTFDEHFERCYNYICGRINEKGKFNLWTNNPILVERRDKFQNDYLNKNLTRKIYKEEWDTAKKNGIMEKILNYYEDY
jgi:uncharacterized protein